MKNNQNPFQPNYPILLKTKQNHFQTNYLISYFVVDANFKRYIETNKIHFKSEGFETK